MDLTEAEDIKKRWQEYTEELYKKDLNEPDNHDGVINHLESDILECKVREMNNRMGKTRDLFKKIRDTKGTFHAKMVQLRTEMVWT